MRAKLFPCRWGNRSISLIQASPPRGGRPLQRRGAGLPSLGVSVESSRNAGRGVYPLGVETWDALRARRNVRRYADRAIPDEHLERILEAARRTPSSMNQQAWDFVLVTDRDRLRELSHTWQYAAHVANSAATIALVTPTSDDRDERDTLQYDLGQVTMSIMLAAADLGIGSGHASVGDQALVRRVLDLPEDRECAMLVALGYPAERPIRPMARPNRRRFEDVVHRESW